MGEIPTSEGATIFFRIAPIEDPALLSVKLVRNPALKVHNGLARGICATRDAASEF